MVTCVIYFGFNKVSNNLHPRWPAHKEFVWYRKIPDKSLWLRRFHIDSAGNVWGPGHSSTTKSDWLCDLTFSSSNNKVVRGRIHSILHKAKYSHLLWKKTISCWGALGDPCRHNISETSSMLEAHKQLNGLMQKLPCSFTIKWNMTT